MTTQRFAGIFHAGNALTFSSIPYAAPRSPGYPVLPQKQLPKPALVQLDNIFLYCPEIIACFCDCTFPGRLESCKCHKLRTLKFTPLNRTKLIHNQLLHYRFHSSHAPTVTSYYICRKRIMQPDLKLPLIFLFQPPVQKQWKSNFIFPIL